MNTTHSSVFKPVQSQFLDLGDPNKQQFKDDLKKKYGRGWRKVWKQLKDEYDGAHLRQLFKEKTQTAKVTAQTQAIGAMVPQLAPATTGPTAAGVNPRAAAIVIALALAIGAAMYFIKKKR